MKVTITTVELNLVIVNKEIATFNINGISGVVHLPSSGPVTVVLDGGYVLGEFIAQFALLSALACCL
jgi:hypothetical protein